jgi:hypothetical protein
MTSLTAAQETYVDGFTTRWREVGITHVIVTTTDDLHVCAYCLHDADTVVLLDEIGTHFEQCLNNDGCRCMFYPITNNTDGIWQADQSLSTGNLSCYRAS